MSRTTLFPSIASLSVAAQVLAALYGIQGGVERTQTPPVIRSTTRVVNVNVVVTDRKGQPVQGLNKDDFQIFDNGHPEQIAFLATRRAKAAPSGGVRSLAPGVYSNNPHSSGIAENSVTVMLFDTVNTSYLSQAYSLGKIRILLRQLQPEDRVGIYVLNPDGLKVVYPAHQPASVLLEAMQRYDDAHRAGGGNKDAAAAENTTGLVELDRFLQGKDDHRPLTRCDPQRFPVTFAAFQEIARSIAGLPGRKAIVWVTEHTPLPLDNDENAFDIARGKFCGIEPYDPDLLLEEPANLRPRPDVRRSQSIEPLDSPSGLTSGAAQDRRLSENDELDLLLRRLNQNNIALYPVSAEGLQTVRLFGPGDTRPGAPLPPQGMDATALPRDPEQMTEAALDAVDAVANVESHQHMELLARLTGGRAYYDRNDLETGISRALVDGKFGYDLAYYPDHDLWNGDWRKIQVKVNRPGVTVLARSGYYAFPESKLLPPKASKQLLEEIAASPLEDTEIPITVKLTPSDRVASSPVEARVYLSAQNLFASHSADEWNSDFEVLFFQFDPKNKILDVHTQQVNLKFTQQKYREALRRGIDTLGILQLKPGAALLYVIVHDKTSDAMGSVRIPLG